MKKKHNSHTVIDLFAGCGGLSLGLYQAGWYGLFAIEKNEFAFETSRNTHSTKIGGENIYFNLING